MRESRENLPCDWLLYSAFGVFGGVWCLDKLYDVQGPGLSSKNVPKSKGTGSKLKERP